jgi:hypothetical protein
MIQFGQLSPQLITPKNFALIAIGAASRSVAQISPDTPVIWRISTLGDMHLMLL